MTPRKQCRLLLLVFFTSLLLGQGAHAQTSRALVPVETSTAEDAKSFSAFDSTLSYYEILGVDMSADETRLKAAYRKMAKRYHPDLNPGDKVAEENLKLVNEAYAVLKDPDKRAYYDRNGKNGQTPGSPFTRAFMEMDEPRRTEFLERWYWSDDSEKILMELVEDLGKKAPTSVEAFQSLISIFNHEKEHQTRTFVNIRMSAFEELTKSKPHRSEVVRDYYKVLVHVFKSAQSQNKKKQYSVGGSERGFSVSHALVAFFQDKELDAETFRRWLPSMTKAIHRSHYWAWQALTENLASMNERSPEVLPLLLEVYAKAVEDLARPDTVDPKRPVWKYGHPERTSASPAQVIAGLIKIADLRPDLSENVLRILTAEPSLLTDNFGRILIDGAKTSEVAQKALESLLSQPSSEQEREKLQKIFDYESKERDFRQNKMSDEEKVKFDSILETIRRSVALSGGALKCEDAF